VSERVDQPDPLVTGDERQRGLHGPVAVRGMDVRVADTRRLDPDPDLPGPRLRDGALLDHQRLPERTNDRGTHGSAPSLRRPSWSHASTPACGARWANVPRSAGPLSPVALGTAAAGWGVGVS